MIKERVKDILGNLPDNAELVAVVKNRSIVEIDEAIKAGVQIIGENYIQSAEEKWRILKEKVRFHLIGHLQKNKIKSAVRIFDMIQTLDSVDLGYALDRECRKQNKIMPVLIEINIALEPQKYGILPDDLENFIKKTLQFDTLKVIGLMTMGPAVNEAEEIRPFFKKTKDLFDKIGSIYGNKLEWKYLSMGMSETYKIAIEEGSNMVRLGRIIFGESSV